jgi:hypothetical protein
MDRAIRQPNAGDSLAFSPAAASINPSQAGDLADSSPGSERLDDRNFAQNLELRLPIVPSSYGIVNDVSGMSTLLFREKSL